MTLNCKFCTSLFWKFVCGSLESKLSNLLGVCSDVLLKEFCSTLAFQLQMQYRLVDSLAYLSVTLSLSHLPPVSSVVPFVLGESTDEETCNLLIGFLTRCLIFLKKFGCSCLCLLCVWPWVSDQVLAGDVVFFDYRQRSSNSLSVQGHTCHTCRSCR